MMHGFGMSFSWLWILIPALLVAVGLPLAARLIRGSDRQRIEGGSGRGLPAASMDAKLYRLAKENDGALTVSDVVVATGMPAERAEKALQRMTDGVRVRMDVTDDGRVVYEFAELLDRNKDEHG